MKKYLQVVILGFVVLQSIDKGSCEIFYEAEFLAAGTKHLIASNLECSEAKKIADLFQSVFEIGRAEGISVGKNIERKR